ncbi:MAG: universal stress protein [Bdellovibrionales bacterium]
MLAQKIIWSVNVFDLPELQDNVLYLLGALTRSTMSEVIPVHVFSPPLPGIMGDSKNLEAAYLALAEKRLAELTARSDISKMREGKVLHSPAESVKAAVKCLMDYAEWKEADAIVVATHARKGVPRMFMGSFAETLIFSSKIPVYTVNPQTKVRERISKILHPTTFQPKYRKTFERIAEMARALDSSLTLYYKEPLVPSPYMSPEIYAFIEREALKRESDANEWLKWAQAYGVNTELHLDNQPGYVASSIAGFAAEKNFDLIAMISESNALSSLLMGSFTRQVIREAPCPVWAAHYEDKTTV